MRWLLVVLAGCNSIFGLRETTQNPPIDAAFFDAPIDAPFSCPAIGVTPSFRRALHTLPVTDCRAYNFSRTTGLAIAQCWEPMLPTFVSEGAIDGIVARADTGDDIDNNFYGEPRVSSDGDTIVRVRYSLYPTYRWTFQLLKRTAPLVWTVDGMLPYDQPETVVAMQPHITNITAGPDLRVLYIDRMGSNPSMITELGNTGAGWQVVDSYPTSTVDSFVSQPSITGDGLRMVFVGSSGAIYYTDRASKNERFGAARAIEGVPPSVYYPVLDEDCGKLYFSALATEFYLLQQ